MPERSTVFEKPQAGWEVTNGVNVNATRTFLGSLVSFSPEVDTIQSRAEGSRTTTTSTMNMEWASGKISCDPAQFTDVAYWHANAFGAPDIQLGGGGVGPTSRDWTFRPPNWSALTPKTQTIEKGSSVRAAKVNYALIKTLGMKYSPKSVSFDAEFIAQKMTDGITLTTGTNEVQTLTITGTPTGGTLTLVWRGETTANLNHNSTFAQVQTALENLPNIDVGDVVCAGGAWPGTPITVTFQGKYASQNVDPIRLGTNALTGGTVPTLSVTETTPGVPLTELLEVPNAGLMWDLYLDSTAANIGVTKLTRAFAAEWRVADLYKPVFSGNTSNNGTFVAHTDTAVKADFKFTVEADATGMAQLANVRSGQTVFIRSKVTGGIIEGAIPYLCQHDFSVKLNKPSELKDEDGVFAIEYTGDIVYDRSSGWQKWMEAKFTTLLTSLA